MSMITRALTVRALAITVLVALLPPIHASPDPCDARSDVPCLRVPRCATGDVATVERFVDTTSGKAPRQETRVELCYDAGGLHVHGNATDYNIFTSSTHCNNETYGEGAVLETFLGPVNTPFDAPRVYQEQDASPSAVLWAGVIHKPQAGNVTNCNLGGPAPAPGALCLTAGTLPGCTGKDAFPGAGRGLGVTTATSATGGTDGRPGWWADHLVIPWSLFDGYFANGDAARAGKGGLPWNLWRLALYRYDYPNAPYGTTKSGFELTAWSPTGAPNFHVPQRFGVMTLVD